LQAYIKGIEQNGDVASIDLTDPRSFSYPSSFFDFFVGLVCLAEDVKLSANGRQPTLLTLLLLIFLMVIIQLE
jgi:hypothetical protein